jgi:hypothetical protein
MLVMIFINNKYTTIYYQIVERAKLRNHIKQKYDGYQTHHIIPRCFGGTNDPTNLVVLSYKEHRVCHRLLINMTERDAKYRMMYAYKLFNKNYDTSWVPTFREYKTESYEQMVKTRKSRGSYKTGKNNNFSDPEIVEQVRQRMIDDNPMKCAKQRKRMRQTNNNPNVRSLSINNINFLTEAEACRYFNTNSHRLRKNYVIQYTDNRPKSARVFNLKDKFITPNGIFKTKKEIQKTVGIPEWTLNTIYRNLDACPTTNGRASKKIDHLNINPDKTWKENGFGLLAVP